MNASTKSLQSVACVLAVMYVTASTAHPQVTRHIDPFLGTEEGSTFLGPSLPFGMVKPGPDVGNNHSDSGWRPTGDINGFSQTHVSGTGGGAKYGNILVQPTTGAVEAIGYGSPREAEQASIGYYRVGLQRYRIGVEITAARRTALYRFTYPATRQANILFDAGHCLHNGSKYGENQHLVTSEVTVVSPTEVSGYSSVAGGWNKQPVPYTVYFYAVSDTPATGWGTWRDAKLQPGGKTERPEPTSTAGAWLSFATKQGQVVHLKVGISFVSIAQAKRNVESEIPGFDFDQIRAEAVSTWNQALGVIEVKGATSEQQQIFYTALYHAMLMPTNRTGENPLWNSDEPSYDDFYTLWDTFRTQGPLLTLIASKRQTDIIRALVDIDRREGWLPDGRSGNFNGRTQGGSDADIYIGDAFVKHLPGIDWSEAYKGLMEDAELPTTHPLMQGRGGLEDWEKLGYVTIEGSDRPGSKQMEYAADDFDVALMAKGLGHDAACQKYLERSGNWKNLWNGDLQKVGVKGFIDPRHRDGTWEKGFTVMQSGSWGSDTFYEGNSWTYSLFVPQDVAGLIQLSGGPQHFVKRLDDFFGVPGRYNVGDEPGFLSPYLYIWAGRQDKTAERVREIIANDFHAGLRGLPGDDDAGAMSSWYVFGAMGIFPNAGQDVYLTGLYPFF